MLFRLNMTMPDKLLQKIEEIIIEVILDSRNCLFKIIKGDIENKLNVFVVGK